MACSFVSLLFDMYLQLCCVVDHLQLKLIGESHCLYIYIVDFVNSFSDKSCCRLFMILTGLTFIFFAVISKIYYLCMTMRVKKDS